MNSGFSPHRKSEGFFDRDLEQIAANSEKMLNVSSEDVAPSERVAYWRRKMNSNFGVAFQTMDTRLDARVRSRNLGRCSVHRMSVRQAHQAHRKNLNDNLCFINFQLSKRPGVFTGRREIELRQGALAIYDASMPYTLSFQPGNESIVLALPKSDLENRVSDFERHLEQDMPHDPSMVSALRTLLTQICNMPQNMKQSSIDGVADSVVSLLAATLNECASNPSQPLTHCTASTMSRVKNYVQANLDDPNLNPSTIADAVGITSSYLHKIFLKSDVTLMQFVWGERLERCRRDIAINTHSRGISQIAYGWGFNDASHFSRSFRKKFDISPREYQKQVQQRDHGA